MNSYEDIEGWMNFEDLYEEIIESLSDNSKIVEIGIWKGKSTYFLCNLIMKARKNIQVDAIDHFKGSKNEIGIYHSFQQVQTLESEAINNLKRFWETNNNRSPYTRVDNTLKIIKEDSTNACKTYADQSLDFVFIDGGHSYSEVSNDILSWMQKLKVGGILAGHDYHSKDHPEVTAAVNYLLPDAKKVSTNCWKYVIPNVRS